MAGFQYGDITEKIIGAAFRVHGTAIIKPEDVHLAQAINYLEAYNLEIGLLVNSGSKRLKFHRFTNKKFNPTLIQHPIKSKSSH